MMKVIIGLHNILTGYEILCFLVKHNYYATDKEVIKMAGGSDGQRQMASWPKSRFFLINGRRPYFCSSSQKVHITHWCIMNRISGRNRDVSSLNCKIIKAGSRAKSQRGCKIFRRVHFFNT